MNRPPKAEKICAVLADRMNEGDIPLTLHSCFQEAVNFTTPFGLISIISGRKPMQPYSIRLKQKEPLQRRLQDAVRLTNEGICCRDGGEAALIAGAEAEDLSILPELPSDISRGCMRQFATGLAKAQGESLAVWFRPGESGNIYADFLKPRLTNLQYAIANRQWAKAEAAVRGFVGCGPGLTPSSDDFLYGYLAARYKFGQLPLEILARLTSCGTRHTGDISGAMLTRLGEGLAARPLLDVLKETAAGILSEDTVNRLLDIGSTSGADILTGVCVGLDKPWGCL